MLTITYGPIYKPKLEAQKYDVVLEWYSDRRFATEVSEMLKEVNDDVYIEDGLTYVPAIRNFAFSSIDYTLIYIPRSLGLNIYVPKSKASEFAELLREYENYNGLLRDFITAKLRERHVPYFYPPAALYYDKYIYLYLGGIEVVLPGPHD